MLDKSLVVLADEYSPAFEQDKALVELRGKPLLKRVIDIIDAIVDEVIVVTDTEERAEKYRKLLDPDVKVVVEVEEPKGPLIGALTGFGLAQGKHCLLLPFDMPFVSLDVIELFFELCPGKTAVVPRWPDQEIEPLHAVYHTASALKATQIAVGEGACDLNSIVEHLGGVRYVSTLVLQEFDPELKTFFTVNTPVDLKMAETLASPRLRKATKKH
jgi:molybdenum cofactor guanylyltransferase